MQGAEFPARPAIGQRRADGHDAARAWIGRALEEQAGEDAAHAVADDVQRVGLGGGDEFGEPVEVVVERTGDRFPVELPHAVAEPLHPPAQDEHFVAGDDGAVDEDDDGAGAGRGARGWPTGMPGERGGRKALSKVRSVGRDLDAAAARPSEVVGVGPTPERAERVWKGAGFAARIVIEVRPATLSERCSLIALAEIQSKIHIHRRDRRRAAAGYLPSRHPRALNSRINAATIAPVFPFRR